jgi:hypothetical protein
MEFIKKNRLMIEGAILIIVASFLLVFAGEVFSPFAAMLFVIAGQRGERYGNARQVKDLINRISTNPNRKLFSSKNWNKTAPLGDKRVVMRMEDILSCLRQSGFLQERKDEKKKK